MVQGERDLRTDQDYPKAAEKLVAGRKNHAVWERVSAPSSKDMMEQTLASAPGLPSLRHTLAATHFFGFDMKIRITSSPSLARRF
jgi:hypothetical protein